MSIIVIADPGPVVEGYVDEDFHDEQSKGEEIEYVPDAELAKDLILDEE